MDEKEITQTPTPEPKGLGFELGPDDRDAIYNHRYQFPTERYVVNFNFETAGRYVNTTNGAGAAVSYGNTPLQLDTGTTATGNVRVQCPLFNADWVYEIYKKYPMIHAVFSTEGGTSSQTADAYVVFGSVDAATPAYTHKHFGFKIQIGDPGKIFATSADGTTQKTTDITPTGYDNLDWTTVRAILIPGKGVSYWVNGKYATQHQTNIPFGALQNDTNPIATAAIRATAGTSTKILYPGPITVSYYDF